MNARVVVKKDGRVSVVSPRGPIRVVVGGQGRPGADGAPGVSGVSRCVTVDVIADANVDISNGLENGDTLNGVTLVTGMLALLPYQSDAAENGIYVVSSTGAASRHSDLDTYADNVGIIVSVVDRPGVSGAGTLWRCISKAGGTIDVTPLSFRPLVAANAIETDEGFTVTDADGFLLFRAAPDEGLTVENMSLRGQDVTDVLSRVLDDDGFIHSEQRFGEMPVMARPIYDSMFRITDDDGFVYFEIGLEGATLVPETATHQALRQYIEVASDPSRDMILNWHADASAPAAVEYRVQGASSWQSAGATVIDIPNAVEKVFSARVTNLSPNTTYEWRNAGSGSANIQKFKTAPDYRARDLRIAFVSDCHLFTQVTDLVHFNALNALIRSDNPDIVVLGGDYVDDNGEVGETRAARWTQFLSLIDNSLRRTDGTQIPVVAMAGNHEAKPASGSSAGGSTTGDGTYSYLDRMFAGLYRTHFENVGGTGYGYVTIANELLLIALETEHASPLSAQIPWISDLLAEKAANYRHVVVLGHVPPFSPTDDSWEFHPYPTIRRQLVPAIQDYPNLRFYCCGHLHSLFASKCLKIDGSGTDADNKWYEDASGIRVIGVGGWASPSHDFETHARVSSIDASSFADVVLSTNGEVVNVDPISAPTNASNDPAPKHYWRLDLKESEITAEAVAIDGTVYCTLTETI